MLKYGFLNENRLEEILSKINDVKAVLLGDMCLDVYWSCDMTKSVLSRETPHFPLPVIEERMSAGAGGNAVINMATLSKNVKTVGIVGTDWRGQCLERCLKEKGIDASLVIKAEDRMTNAYIKPMRFGYSGVEVEDPRIDFESFSSIDNATEDKILSSLDKAVKDAQVLCVSDQFKYGCVTPRVRRRVNEISKKLLTVVDSRYNIDKFKNAFLKPNEIECARAIGKNSDYITKGTEKDIENALITLSKKTNSDVCMTFGEKGARILKDNEFHIINGVPALPPVDTCGAGDCFLSSFALALGTGASPCEAASFGCIASAISVKKLNTTGGADENEIRNKFSETANDKSE